MPFSGESVQQFLDANGLSAIFVIMLLKEIGIPIPLPADLIMLGAAAGAASGKFPLGGLVFAFLIPMLLGGLVQYTVARGPGRALVYRIGGLVGLTGERLDRAMERVRKGGALAVSVGLTTPGIRVAIVPASGLASIPMPSFAAGLIAGSAFFLSWHLAIGLVGGSILSQLNTPALSVGLLIVALPVFGAIGWRLVRNASRKSAVRASQVAAITDDSLGTWAEASCPACIAIAFAQVWQAGAKIETEPTSRIV